MAIETLQAYLKMVGWLAQFPLARLARISHWKNREQSCILNMQMIDNVHLPINLLGVIVNGL